MKLRFHLVFLAAPLFPAAGCRTPNAAEGPGSQVKSDEVPPLTCETGEAASFTLGAIDPLPKDTVVTFPGPHRLQAQDDGRHVRVDVCADNFALKATLRRVVYRFSEMQRYTAADATAAGARIAGVSEAIFDNDTSKLDVFVPQAAGAKKGIWLKGWKVEGEPTFATAVPVMVEDGGSLKPTALYWLAGSFSYGDPLKGLKCPGGETWRSSGFTLGTAQFTAERCEFLGGGETTGYRIKTLVVTDSNPALPPEARKPVTLADETALKALNYRWNHHNACDSFYLKLPHAEYAATAAPCAGCGQAVPNAPERKYTDEDHTFLHYRIKYEGGAWQDGKLDGCPHHFLSCRGQRPQ